MLLPRAAKSEPLGKKLGHHCVLSQALQTVGLFFYYLFLAAQGLYCCTRAFLIASSSKQGCSLLCCAGFAAAAFLVKHGLRYAGSAVVARGLHVGLVALGHVESFPDKG